MENVIRNVSDIDTADRRAIEHLIGADLAEHQQIIISVVDLDIAVPEHSSPSTTGVVDLDVASPEHSSPSPLEERPAWWNIYEGLSDEEVDRLDQSIRRANLTRVFE